MIIGDPERLAAALGELAAHVEHNRIVSWELAHEDLPLQGVRRYTLNITVRPERVR